MGESRPSPLLPDEPSSCASVVVTADTLDIRRLLRERPKLIGLSAPVIPPLSPGMGSIEPRDYDVLSFDESGNVAVYARY